MKKPLRIVLLLACLLGMVLSALSLHNHYSQSGTSYCSLGATFNCDVVNRSIYSEVYGVPVALIGLVGYVLLLGLSWFSARRLAARGLLVAALGGLGFALYLTYIEEHILVTWCLLCLGSLLAISIISMLAALNLRQLGHSQGRPATRQP